MKLDASASSDPGKVRSGNEDSYFVDVDLGLLVVADGMGGHRSGEVASALAVRKVSESIASASTTEPHETLLDAIASAEEAVVEQSLSSEKDFGMGTTVVMAFLPQGNALWIAHVGDSRAYLSRDGALELLTEDHTIYNQLRLAGQLTDDPGMRPPRNMLSQAIGVGMPLSPEIESIELKPGDRIMLCTDGLTDMVNDTEIASVLGAAGAPADACTELVGLANNYGGADNITVVVADISGDQPDGKRSSGGGEEVNA